MAHLHSCLLCSMNVELLFDCFGALIVTVAKRNVVVIDGVKVSENSRCVFYK